MVETGEKRGTILVVDDAQSSIDLFKEILKGEYSVTSVNKGKDALETARNAPVDLILLDVMMPDMNGYEVCRLLKEDERTRDIPVLFLTGVDEAACEAKGFEAGAVDYITKPVSVPVVLARVKRHLELKQAQKQLVEWNHNLKERLLHSVAMIRETSQALMASDERVPRLSGYHQLIEVVSGILEFMGGGFGVHARMVSEIAGDAARKMNLGADMVAKVRLAGLLHDVGKMDLESAFREQMDHSDGAEQRKHPVKGQQLLQSLPELSDIGEMIRWHHEAFDGSGFPDGLKGEGIPVGARLIAIADGIEQAVSSIDSTKSEYALNVIRAHAGTLYDPELVPYFEKVVRIIYFETA
ncbi:response regulator [Geomesophilobacter sediminis]|uniref:Response regulator n=1 Tax=Geomesophilobacter sediminis TaxID=2798584 RepID=A0A8J7IMQ7_9BACT|nr:HD domain-containing phosphohydrolase [Geomesophilobacter sediminis]MBJ6724143.1 response regulator [Geomesophilobacter sediminis]